MNRDTSADTPVKESVWDYPRPPRLEHAHRHLRIVFAGETVADSRRAWRVLETSHPPVYYLPPADIRMEWLSPASGSSLCEFKGEAVYWTLAVHGRRAQRAAWSYPRPARGFEGLKDHLAFYAGRVDACFVDGERVVAQPGDFYGGWITSDLVGPFKGGPGSRGW